MQCQGAGGRRPASAGSHLQKWLARIPANVSSVLARSRRYPIFLFVNDCCFIKVIIKQLRISNLHRDNKLNYRGNRSSVCGLFSKPTSDFRYGKCRQRKADHQDIVLRTNSFFFGHQNHTFGHTRFSTRFFSLKMADSEKVVLQY